MGDVEIDENDFPRVQDPSEYQGESAIKLVCTQTDLSSYKQTKLVHAWVELLPTLNLTHLWFASKVNQDLFDAACEIPTLESLNVKWSSINRLDGIAKTKSLATFILGSSPQVESIECLAGLDKITALTLENLKDIQDLSPLTPLKSLKVLSFGGSIWTTQKVSSLQPLGELNKIEEIWVQNLRAKNMDLSCLHHLTSLKKFMCAMWWDKEQMIELKKAIPGLEFGWDPTK